MLLSLPSLPPLHIGIEIRSRCDNFTYILYIFVPPLFLTHLQSKFGRPSPGPCFGIVILKGCYNFVHFLYNYLRQHPSFVGSSLRKFPVNVEHGVKEWNSYTNNFDKMYIRILSIFETFIVATWTSLFLSQDEELRFGWDGKEVGA